MEGTEVREDTLKCCDSTTCTCSLLCVQLVAERERGNFTASSVIATGVMATGVMATDLLAEVEQMRVPQRAVVVTSDVDIEHLTEWGGGGGGGGRGDGNQYCKMVSDVAVGFPGPILTMAKTRDFHEYIL